MSNSYVPTLVYCMYKSGNPKLIGRGKWGSGGRVSSRWRQGGLRAELQDPVIFRFFQ